MSFGNSCTGYISFLGHGNIEGMLNLYGECHFTGKRKLGPDVPCAGPNAIPRYPDSMRSEWDGYNRRAYDEAERNRWG